MLKESFIAPTPEEAYKLAIRKYGSIDNFKIVKASQYKNKEGVLVSEITIEVEEDIYLHSSGIDEEEALLEEINILKAKMSRMKEVLNPVQEDKSVIEEVKNILISRGLNKEWIDYMLDPFIGTQVAEDKSLLLSFVLEEIEEAINISKKPIESRINIFVGPTGVGKTTTIAKLTGWSVLKGLNPDSIALINLDNFRVAAYEQLGYYAKTMGVDYYCPNSLQELKDLIDSLHTKELILIDTAGNSPYDLNKLLNTVKFCKSIDESLENISTTLVVSVTAKYADLKDIYEHFSFLNIESIIATKFDETKKVGNLIAFLLDSKLPVSFLSVGQEVPIDIEIATKRRILEAFTGELNDK